MHLHARIKKPGFWAIREDVRSKRPDAPDALEPSPVEAIASRALVRERGNFITSRSLPSLGNEENFEF